MENKWHCIMMAGGTKRNCFSGRKSYPSLSVSSFIHYSLSIQPICHPLSVPDTRPGWPLRQRGRGSQIWTLVPPLLLFPILSRSQNSQTHTHATFVFLFKHSLHALPQKNPFNLIQHVQNIKQFHFFCKVVGNFIQTNS